MPKLLYCNWVSFHQIHLQQCAMGKTPFTAMIQLSLNLTLTCNRLAFISYEFSRKLACRTRACNYTQENMHADKLTCEVLYVQYERECVHP